MQASYEIIQKKVDDAFKAKNELKKLKEGKNQEGINQYEQWVFCEGDVYSSFDDEYVKDKSYFTFELIDSYERKNTIRVFYSETGARGKTKAIDLAKRIKDKCVKVIGKVQVFANERNSGLQIAAEAIIPIGDCSRIAKKRMDEKACVRAVVSEGGKLVENKKAG